MRNKGEMELKMISATGMSGDGHEGDLDVLTERLLTVRPSRHVCSHDQGYCSSDEPQTSSNKLPTSVFTGNGPPD
jgi:hypothetical protein